MSAARTVRWVAQPVEPGRFWIRYRPQPWSAMVGPWTDLALGAIHLTTGASKGDTLDFPPQNLEGLAYLPPVPEESSGSFGAWVETALADGASLLLQSTVGAGETLPELVPVVPVVWDPLAALLSGESWSWPQCSSAEGIAVWPLIPGLSTDPKLWEKNFDGLRSGGFSTVQPIVPELTPVQRRELAERLGDDAFEELFHGPRPDERLFSRAAARHGLAPFMNRPPAAGASPRRQNNAHLAERLALAGELWLRLDRPDPQGQALFRAARWADETSYDVAALAREGNLAVVEAVDSQSAELIERVVAHESTDAPTGDLAAQLLTEYLSGESSPHGEEDE